MHLAVIDMGSPKKTKKAPEGNLGWWIESCDQTVVNGSHDIDECIAAVADALTEGPVALASKPPCSYLCASRQTT